MDDLIAFRGDRGLWIDFVAAVKKRKRHIWDELAPLLREYIKKK